MTPQAIRKCIVPKKWLVITTTGNPHWKVGTKSIGIGINTRIGEIITTQITRIGITTMATRTGDIKITVNQTGAIAATAVVGIHHSGEGEEDAVVEDSTFMDVDEVVGSPLPHLLLQITLTGEEEETLVTCKGASAVASPTTIGGDVDQHTMTRHGIG